MHVAFGFCAQAVLCESVEAAHAAHSVQAAIARRLGIKVETVNKWENDLAEPRANKLQMLAGILNVSLTWLLASFTYSRIREFRGETEGGGNAIEEALERLSLLKTDKPFRRFVIARALLMCSALSAPFYVALGQQRLDAATRKAMRVDDALRIELDGRPLERDCLFVEIANTRFTGTSFLIAPGAEPDDGLLDVILVSRLPRRRVLQLFPSIYEGRHVEYDEVETCQAREVRIVADEPLGLAPDGEIRGEMPVTIRCLHRDLEVFAPARDERKD